MTTNFRIGQIVPSSNTTMETEIPAMLHARHRLFPEERFTFHSARMRMMHVDPDELKRMDLDSDRCAVELSDARCDVLAYACLVAIMCQGPGYHRVSEQRLGEVAEANGAPTPVISSAGALVAGLKTIDAKKVAIVTPYLKQLTAQVAGYLESESIEVTDALSLEVADNLAVGRLDPADLLDHVERLNITGADAVVLSACVQMPSLSAIEPVQDKLGVPVVTAAAATVHRILTTLRLDTTVPDAGHLLSGAY
ncbi:aspartate/glutamate racemase family protein [Amycolatopsis sp. La24]|uniref:maleate cis-trans isomerase family protein n=1 Tax=Amycolatopsis sp. La24 TaxID=3028304 RepID=UPI0023AE6DC0|nr:aspartate/glutamate racemase family protein [Amycolatopsis sp. La24]